MSSNDKKSATLGMPHGTANGRLKKLILFNLLAKHRENVCIRCGGVISSPAELSIEHIKPWEGISADLFWDLNNISFSHPKCNTPHRYGPGRERFVGPEGTAWCGDHKEFLPVDRFYSDITKANGLRTMCKLCYDARRGRA